MITGATKNKVDAIWQRMWEGGIANPTDVISQLTYLMFIRQLDDRDADADHDNIPDILERWGRLDAEHERSRTDKSFLVPAQEIRDNDYDFSFNKYTETVYERIEYPPTEEILADLEAINQRITHGLTELKAMLGGSDRR